MKIILIHKAEFHKRPPVISTLSILLELGYEVILITTGISEEWKAKLANKNCQVFTYLPKKNNNVIFKIHDYLSFKKFAYKHIDKFYDNDTIIWVESAYTIVALGDKLNKYKHILQIQELHESFKFQLRAIAKVIHQSLAVFMPEYNRTVFYQVWFKLQHRPYVLPNKPYFIPTDSELDKLENKYKNLIDIFNTKKVILYQGIIDPNRDLSNYIKATKKLGPDFQFVLLGKDYNMVDYYKSIDPTIIHIDFIPAPDYLCFTRKAFIGIVSYNTNSLNNVYCAPNKIWEYSYFRLPMIGNDIPGLKYSIYQYKVGVCIDEHSVDSIYQAIKSIDKNYESFTFAATTFYNSINNLETIKQVLNNLKQDN